MNWWVESRTAGVLKKRFYWILQKYYGFSKWHIEPVNDRPYGLETIRMLNRLIDRGYFEPGKPFIEIGCGLGEIICSLNWAGGKVGYDLSAEALRAAAFIHGGGCFCKGTFSDIQNIKSINCFIMINFIHAIPCEILKDEIDRILTDTDIRMFVMDTFRNNADTEYLYSHDGRYLFGSGYRLLKRSGGFQCAHGARRYIEYWEKAEGAG